MTAAARVMPHARRIDSPGEYQAALVELANDYPREPDRDACERPAFDALADAIEAYESRSAEPDRCQRQAGPPFVPPQPESYPSLAFGEVNLRLRRTEALYARQLALVERLQEAGIDTARAERCLATCHSVLRNARISRERVYRMLLDQHSRRFGSGF